MCDIISFDIQLGSNANTVDRNHDDQPKCKSQSNGRLRQDEEELNDYKTGNIELRSSALSPPSLSSASPLIIPSSNQLTDSKPYTHVSFRDNNIKPRGIIIPIDSTLNSSSSIDSVGLSSSEFLKAVPLVYDPIKKQLFLPDETLCAIKNGTFHQNEVVNLNNVSQMDNQNEVKDELQVEVNSKLNGKSNKEDMRCVKNNETEQSIITNGSIRGTCSESHSHKHDDQMRKRYEEEEEESKVFSNLRGSLSSLSLEDLDLDLPSSIDANKHKRFPLPISLQSILNRIIRKNNSCPNSGSNNGNITVNHHQGLINVSSSHSLQSTTGLILENRPPNLPKKTLEEEKKHKQEYEEMIRQSKKKEAKVAKVKRKLINKQHQQEAQVMGSIRVWKNEILPNWDKVRDSKKVRDLWWKGIPSRVREDVWNLAIDNELNITMELYEICVSRSREKVWMRDSGSEENGETAAELIKLDVSRTFPQLGLFQKSGPYYDILSTLLGAYVTYRPDIGYVQGMSFLAAMLLLNMQPAQAFICFANLINNQLLLSFFRVDQRTMNAYYLTYEEFFKENLPKLYNHFKEHKLTPDLYLVDYIYTLFSRSLPLDVASVIWDLFLRDGDEFIFRASLGILSMHQTQLFDMDFIHLAQFLTKLPDDINQDDLFASIANIKMTLANDNKRTFSSVLQTKLANKC
ncbi:unnamed protein product [Sphagnum balticum]